MPTRKATATWEGGLKNGKGSFKGESGAISAQYNFSSRFESGAGSNPEELLAAAEAACFSMALSSGSGEERHARHQGRDDRGVHGSGSPRRLRHHHDEAQRAGDGAENRQGEIRPDRAGDQRRMPGLESIEGQRRPPARSETGLETVPFTDEGVQRESADALFIASSF